MRLARLAATTACTLALTASLAACGGDDSVKASPADQASNPLCAKAARQWPKTVAGQKARKVTTKSSTVHAWGDPAIIARCGVEPPGPTPTGCVSVDGIDWVGSKLSDGGRYITYGRSPAIEVLVPKKDDSLPPLGAFTKAVQQIPQGSHHCS